MTSQPKSIQGPHKKRELEHDAEQLQPPKKKKLSVPFDSKYTQ